MEITTFFELVNNIYKLYFYFFQLFPFWKQLIYIELLENFEQLIFDF